MQISARYFFIFYKHRCNSTRIGTSLDARTRMDDERDVHDKDE